MNVERQLRSIAVSAELAVKLKFEESIVLPLKEGEENNRVKTNIHTIESEQRPHKDLVDSLKKLRQHAIDMLEIDLNPETKSKQLPTYTVSEIKLSGDHSQRKSRVKLVLAKFVKKTGKVSEMETSQFILYPKNEDASKYPDIDKVALIVEDIIEEVWSYMAGKFDPEEDVQLALFPERESTEA